MNPSVSARLESLYPAILKKAAILAAQSYGALDADDLAQEMSLHIARRLEENPARLAQKDAYLIGDACQNRATNLLRSQRRQSSHIAENAKITDEPEEEEQEAFLVIIQDQDYSPEEHLERLEFYRRVAGVVEFLSKKDKQIISFMIDGKRDVEIAAALGVSKSAVSQRKSSIARFMAAFAKE